MFLGNLKIFVSRILLIPLIPTSLNKHLQSPSKVHLMDRLVSILRWEIITLLYFISKELLLKQIIIIITIKQRGDSLFICTFSAFSWHWMTVGEKLQFRVIPIYFYCNSIIFVHFLIHRMPFIKNSEYCYFEIVINV